MPVSWFAPRDWVTMTTDRERLAMVSGVRILGRMEVTRLDRVCGTEIDCSVWDVVIAREGRVTAELQERI
jgi:hypothetical protein